MIPKNTRCRTCIETKMAIFDVLTPKEKEILNAGTTCSLHRRGEIIYKEGERPAGLICLSDGKAKIFKEGVGGREQIIRMAKPVGFIGFRAFFADDVYISSALAIEDCLTCTIDRITIHKLLRLNPLLSINIIKFMARELGYASMRTVTLTQKHIRGRLAESLLFLRDTYGTEEDGMTIKIYLSREDLANLSNMTTSNAIRTLSNFAHEKVITIDGRRLKILDIISLERISEQG